MEAQRYLEDQLAYQKRLQEIAHKIHCAENTDEILINLQEDILSLFDADRITVYALDPVRKEILSKMKTGQEVKEIRVPINYQSIAGFCALTGRIVNAQDVYDRDQILRIHPQLRFDKNWDRLTGYKTTQVLAAPISQDNVLQGVIQLINKRGGQRFSPEDESAVLDIARVLGSAFYKNDKVAKKHKNARFDFLVDQNIVGRNEMALVMTRARKQRSSVEAILMADFNVTKDDIGRSLAEFYRTDFIPFDEKMDAPETLLKGLKPNFLKKNTFVPVGVLGDTVVMAMANPDSLPTRDTIHRLIRSKKFRYCVSLKEDIHAMIDKFFDTKTRDTLSVYDNIEDIVGRLQAVEETPDEPYAMGEDDSIIVQLVNKMIIDACHQGASDIHVEPRSGKRPAAIRMRLDGSCKVYQTIPYTYKRAVVSRLKIMADLDIAERRMPQDGKIKFRRYQPLDIELRVATIPTAGGNEDVVMRILKPGRPSAVHELGMSEGDYAAFIDMIRKPYGMVLVVGPTGSGKTSTLHSAMQYINKVETKIWTAEDPVEITQDGLRQVQVQPKIGFTFASAMRAFLRADPDVIMVGEMRDKETMAMGIEASLTGHLVLSTLHTNSAPETIARLLDMGMDPFNFSDALLGILAQRLTRTLCPHCKQPYSPSRDEYNGLARIYGQGFDQLGYPHCDNLLLYRPKGCAKCNHTGYLGRTALFELLRGTDEMKSLVQKRAPMHALRRQAIVEDNMITLMQDGIRKVFLGVTDIRQVRRVCLR